MAAPIDSLVVGRVIGDVVEMFIYFGSKHVTNGCTLKPSLTADTPRLLIGGHSNLLFLLVITEPDAPSPSEPSMREWVHCLTSGKEILSYVAPKSTVGIHRYILVLYEQKQPVGSSAEPPASRANFNTRRFAEVLQLGLPVATVYFNAQKKPASRTRR